MFKTYTIMCVFLLSGMLQATEYVKTWVNDVPGSALIQGDQFAWEFDVSVNGGSANIQLILDINENETYDESDIILTEFMQSDGTEGNDGPGDADGQENGIVFSPLGPFGFAPAYYLFIATDANDHSQASAAFHVSALSEPTATLHGNISKADVAPPSAELQNIMVLAQLDEGFAGFWSGLSDSQGNYTINLPDTAIGTVWDVELFNDTYGKYVMNDHYEAVTIHAGANTGFNFHFNLPSSYIYGKLTDDLGNDIILNDYIILENTSTNDEFYSEIKDGSYSVPVSFPPGKNSAQFRINFWGDSIPPHYMIPNTWENENFYVNISEGDSLQKNIVLQHTDEEIYVQVLMEGSSPGMAFEVEAYDDQGYTRTVTDNEGRGVLSVKGTDNYYVMIRFDNEDLGTLPTGYTFDGGTHSNGVAGDTVTFNIIAATSSISGSLTFAEGDGQVSYNPDDFFVEIEENSWSSTLRADFDASLEYRFDLADGTYNLRFYADTDDFLALPAQYEDLIVNSDSLQDINFELNYCHANIILKLKNAPFINPTNYYLDVHTNGEWPNVYQTWANGDLDSTFHFRVCDGEWVVQPPQTDTSFTVVVSNEGINYYLEYDYQSKNISTGLEEKTRAAERFELLQNYPNPFNPVTTIAYTIGSSGTQHLSAGVDAVSVQVDLSIYNLLGQQIVTLVDKKQSAGHYNVTFDAGNLPSGLYFYKLDTSDGYVATRRMLLVK